MDGIRKLQGKDKDKGLEIADTDKTKDKETPTSIAIKNKIKAELSDKTISDTDQADALISGVYAKYKAEGLKEIKLVPESQETKNSRIDGRSAVSSI